MEGNMFSAGFQDCQGLDCDVPSICSFFFLFFFLVFGRASPAAYGGSQARNPVRAVAAGLHHSHSNARSEPTERGQGSNPQPHGS